MEHLEILIFLMFVAALLVGIAQKIHIPYPIALVLGGASLGFIPYVQPIYFDPNLILVVVLPPLLYYASFGISFREFRKNWKDIFSLALGLVVVTTCVIGALFKWIFPQFSWPLAFAFGAIVSPPDAIAVTAILKRFSISPRLLAILEGESLVNDASALVLYRLALLALLSGSFSLTNAGIEFIKIASGGVLVGALVGITIQRFSRQYLDPIVGIVFSFTIPYVTYIFADYLGVSGVLAVVVNGLIGSRVLMTHHSSLRRILGFATWDIIIILINCFVFTLIGLQLRGITAAMTAHEMLLYTGYAVLITAALVLVRLIWVYAKSSISYIIALRSARATILCPQIMREAVVISWSGMRGIVSLAAALALPFTLADGAPLVGRNEVIFITFMVIMFSLIIPGFTLAPLIDWLKINHASDDLLPRNVRKKLATAAEEKIHHLHSIEEINEEERNFLLKYFDLRHQALEIASSTEKKMQNVESVRLKIIQEQRKRLLELWKQKEIDDKLLVYLEHELDVEETHIARAELK